MSREFIIYTDESDRDGKYFANFYGGALIRSADVDAVRAELGAAAAAVGLTAEIKWQKVSAGYLDRYKSMMDTFFQLVAEDRIKVRIMFTQRRFVPVGLSQYHREHAYHLLYYQFIKHAFGLQFSNPRKRPVRLRIYLDKLPDKQEKNVIFTAFLAGLENARELRRAQILVPQDQIAEVDSHDHVVLQCLDVVLGAMQFRLNDKHQEGYGKGEKRGSRTAAKEELYRHICTRLRRIHPNFNVGITTSTSGDNRNRWKHSYRHWLFRPREWQYDITKVKPRPKQKAEDPGGATHEATPSGT